MTESLLIIFVRNPILGKVKTRLASTLGNQLALKIYKKLLQHTADITRSLPMDKVVFYSEFMEGNDLWDETCYRKQLQSPGDLGERIESAFRWGFQSGYRQICIIGSDCYELTAKIILQGFDVLNTHDAVMGPSRDGGYYLLGLNEMHPWLFEAKNWGTDSVASSTLDDFNRLDLNYDLLEPLNDIDKEQDLGDFEF